MSLLDIFGKCTLAINECGLLFRPILWFCEFPVFSHVKLEMEIDLHGQ